ncbi:YceI family protein [Caulobacter sp. BK020]|uniref:YceI family protein n=1 Tax=Caulobacter sp. BK020 TaxID=2512117 RepID=UPI00104C47DD|nr:YceI family protein [Caulobacter sp. BK020]TCS14002.1 polyisoprenoid-binding protein YceI [Caulobacter sp. BK020]
MTYSTVRPHARRVLWLTAGAAALALAACSPPADKKAEAPAAPSASSAAAPAADKFVMPKVPAGDYTLDPAHANLEFKVNHLGFSHYTARFSDFDAKLKFDPANPSASSVEATIDPKSLTLPTPPAGFKDELTGKAWLDTGQYPTITFRSTKVEVTGANTAKVTGDFTLHGVTKPVVLDATFNGGYAGHPMDPHARIGFSAHGTFNRSEFGMGFGVPAPGTTMGVGDAVEVTIEAEFSGPPLPKTEAAAPAQ